MSLVIKVHCTDAHGVGCGMYDVVDTETGKHVASDTLLSTANAIVRNSEDSKSKSGEMGIS